jgi:hypothetical protein
MLERITAVMPEPANSGRQVELGRFVQGSVAWLQATALANQPAALVMHTDRPLTLYAPTDSGVVNRREIVIPVTGSLARSFVVETSRQALASQLVPNGLVAVGVTTFADPPRTEDVVAVAHNRLAFFTIGCGVQLQPQRR